MDFDDDSDDAVRAALRATFGDRPDLVEVELQAHRQRQAAHRAQAEKDAREDAEALRSAAVMKPTISAAIDSRGDSVYGFDRDALAPIPMTTLEHVNAALAGPDIVVTQTVNQILTQTERFEEDNQFFAPDNTAAEGGDHDA